MQSKLVSVYFMPVANNNKAVVIKSKPLFMTKDAANLLKSMLHTDMSSSSQLTLFKTK
jgi:hypothetical protein